MSRSWEVSRPFSAPDHSDPAARAGLDPRAPLQVGDRVAWVRPLPSTRRATRGRTADHLGTVAALEVVGGKVVEVWLYLDEGEATEDSAVAAPVAEVHPRPGR